MRSSRHFNHLVLIGLTLLTVAVVTVVILMFVPINYSRAVDPADYSSLHTLYRHIRSVSLSQQNNQEIETIIKNRLDCYEQTQTYQQRTTQCYSDYITGIVAFSRENIRSNPLLGQFLSKTEACPVIYNICRGSENLPVDQCINVEQQCIDFMLDHYWRGQGSIIEF